MASVRYVGDEVCAAGWRLAGVDARVPAPGDEAAAFAQACAHASLVLVGAGVAARLDRTHLDRARAGLSPLVLVVPDTGDATPPDVAVRIRALLGLEAPE